MFSAELKFTVDCLKFWLNKSCKINNLELQLEEKITYMQNHPKNENTLRCLCDFPIESKASNGWSSHVFKAEHLFLENIYSEKQMKVMGIENFDVYSQKLEKILSKLDNFCDSIEHEVVNSLMSGKENADIESITEQIKRIKTSCKDNDKPAKEKSIAFL